MKLSEWLDQWSMSSLKINVKFLEMEFHPNDYDKNAAWELYVELLTRVATQRLPDKDGDEKTALDSIYALFDITRNILKTHGRHGKEFTKISIVVLNQVIRPFTAKWHKLSLEGAFKDSKNCAQFRKELTHLQNTLHNYTRMLSGLAGVEDLTNLENHS